MRSLRTEVAYALLVEARDRMAPLYAASGFREYWLDDALEHAVKLFRASGPQGYEERAWAVVGATLRLQDFHEVELEIAKLF